MKNWSEFDKFEQTTGKYLPMMGEGKTMATQAVTAVCKLVYKWYNDGDVYDNTCYMDGWCNDLSTYANWLFNNLDGRASMLAEIGDCWNNGDYEDILYDVAESVLDDEYLEELNKREKVSSIYEEEGVFRFEEPDEEEDW